MRHITTEELRQWLLADGNKELLDFLRDVLNEEIRPETIRKLVVEDIGKN